MSQLCFITTCKGRLAFLKQTLGTVASQPDSSCVVVDYSCPDRTGDWVQQNYPAVRVVRVEGQTNFHPCISRNAGARAADAPWLCFFDADIALDPSFTTTVLPTLRPGCFYRPGPLGENVGISGTHVCAREDFNCVGGYDEVFQGWGEQDFDIFGSLLFAGVSPQSFPAGLVRHIPHGHDLRTQFYDIKNLPLSWTINRVYRLVKFDLMKQLGNFLPPAKRQHLYEVIARLVTSSLQGENQPELRIELESGETLPIGWKFARSLTYKFSK